MKSRSVYSRVASVVMSLGLTLAPLGAIVPTTAHAAGEVTVTINKYIDGVQATASSAQSNSFPMSATWNDPTGPAGSGTGTYTLDSTQTPAYQTQTALFDPGSDYSTNEVTGGSVVGANCSTGQPYALTGYTTGTTTAIAQAGTPSMVVPAFTNMQTNQFVIVWNHSCTLPTVTSVSPTSGPTTGGTLVTISGTDLTGTTDVKFGTTTAASVTNVSSSTITAIAPAHPAGIVNVTVTTLAGTSATSSADQYTYTVVPASPTVTSVSPTSGPTTGGTLVTISGTDLTGTTDVKFGTTTAASVTNVSSSTVTAVSPAHAAGIVDVTVTTAGGTSATSSADQFTYVAPVATSTVSVTIDKFVDGAMATASSSNSGAFPMNATWNDPAGIGSGSGQFTLNASSTPAYEAQTVEFNLGSNYSTSEATTSPALVGTACTASSTPQFALVGYTTGNSFVEAAAGTPTTTTPSFTAMTQDKFVIVWNTTCAGNALGVPPGEAPVEAIDTTATADGTFANGWKYIFNVTVPTFEPNIAMLFSDWFNTANSTSFSVANNIRISSAQADNGGATILVTAPNTYTTPDLHITGDLSTTTPGMQIEILVEAAVPAGTPSGSYSTNYSIRSQ